MHSDKSKVKLWTCQSDIVINTIEKKGVYHVKKEYIEKKYNEVSKVFLYAYNWFINSAQSIVSKPIGAEYPIWTSLDNKYVKKYKDSFILEIEVNKENAIIFDRAKWNKILNLSYIPKNYNDEKEFIDILERYGIFDQSKIILSNFYPQLKTKIIKSWDRLFNEEIVLSESKQAALWEIRKEWIVSIK